MFKNTKSTKWTALLVALVLITSLFVVGTIARYVTSTSSEDSARVAVWGINEAGTTMNLFKNKYTIDGSGELKAKSVDDEDIIAPGLNGASQFKIVNTHKDFDPEVMYEIAISLDDSEIADEIKNHPGIEWKVDNGEWGTWEEFKTELLSLSGDPSGVKVYAPLDVDHEFANGKTHTVAWQWIMDSGYDVEDTAMGNYAAETGDITAKLSITVTARQTDVDSTGMLEGNGSIVNSLDPQPLVFRADDNYEDFKSVEINGTEINKGTDYTVEPGSIKVTLAKSYLETLSNGKYTINIISTNKETKSNFYVKENTTIIHNGVIPEGGIYYTGLGWTCAKDYSNYENKYIAGEEFPTPQDGDLYIYGDYEYRYNYSMTSPGVWEGDRKPFNEVEGWGVFYIGNSTIPNQIITTINNKNIVSLENAFEAISLHTVKITKAPIIPNTVIDITRAFAETDIEKFPVINTNIKYMEDAFSTCLKIENVVEINHMPTRYDYAFFGTPVIWFSGNLTLEEKQQLGLASNIRITNLSLKHENVISEGGIYYVQPSSQNLHNSTNYIATTIYSSGDNFPTPQAGDVYVYDSNIYIYGVDAILGVDSETMQDIPEDSFTNEDYWYTRGQSINHLGSICGFIVKDTTY